MTSITTLSASEVANLISAVLEYNNIETIGKVSYFGAGGVEVDVLEIKVECEGRELIVRTADDPKSAHERYLQDVYSRVLGEKKL